MQDNIQPDIILLMIGTNNGFGCAAGSTEAMEKLVNNITRSRPNAAVLVSSIPDTANSYINNSHCFDSSGKKAREMAATSTSDNLYYVNMREAGLSMNTMDFSDGVHLTENGSAKIARVWHNAIMTWLKTHNSAIPSHNK